MPHEDVTPASRRWRRKILRRRVVVPQGTILGRWWHDLDLGGLAEMQHGAQVSIRSGRRCRSEPIWKYLHSP